jgi:hypothetical protein
VRIRVEARAFTRLATCVKVRCFMKLNVKVSGWLIVLAAVTAGYSEPAMQVIRSDSNGTNLLLNPGFEQVARGGFRGWSSAPNGLLIAPGEGRDATQALACLAANSQEWAGASQTLVLNRTNVRPVVVRGWSRAQDVDGGADSGYSLYVDIVYVDGTPLWGQTGNFSTGTHDWEERQFVILPNKPIRYLTLYCILRGHTGRVWFDDVSVEETVAPSGAYLFQGRPVLLNSLLEPPSGPTKVYVTDDGLRLSMTDGRVTGLRDERRELTGSAPAGFLVRDVAADSDWYVFKEGVCPELNLRLDAAVRIAPDHLAVEGRISDTTGRDRAVTLVFALPINAQGWTWGDDIRQRRLIGGRDEFSTTVPVNCGANGQLSIYPMACINDDRTGIALALDMTKPAQYRLVYQAGTGQFFIAYDFGLVIDTARSPSSAEFRFVIYRFDPAWGFRAAWEKFMRIFPEQFQVRSHEQGIWMPFTDVSTVAGWSDFGFRYHEGNNNVGFDDQNGILSFRYTEPMTWWMSMAPQLPRTEAAAIAVRDDDLLSSNTNDQRMALVSLSTAMWDANGQPELLFRNEPWANGAVWSLNPNPFLPTQPNAGTVHWNDALREILYGSSAPNVLDGEYLDSLEGHVTANLNYRREHFAPSTVPLTFASDTCQPALWKALAVYEFTRWITDDVHRLGKLSFANGLPYQFTFLCPCLDIMGTETDWLSSGQYTPPSHAQMDLWRTLAAKKPYLLLMNTDFDRFGTNLVEQYFERSLFYGMFPSMFSHNASDNPYWENPAWYNRDRDCFKRYIPIIKRVAEAGWQPVTLASVDNSNLLIERFGPSPDGTVYFTLMNESAMLQTAHLSLSNSSAVSWVGRGAIELLSGDRLAPSDNGWSISLAPQATAVVMAPPAPQFLPTRLGPDGMVRLSWNVSEGTVQVLESSTDLTTWSAVDTNLTSTQPGSWLANPAASPNRFYRLRW